MAARITNHEVFPVTAEEALKRYDAGLPVWTIEMGGIGPGYEQSLQVFMMEVVRVIKDRTLPENNDELESFFQESTKHVPNWAKDGLSGAQWGAACSFAYAVVKNGWRATLSNVEGERHIQFSNHWVGPPRTEDKEEPKVKVSKEGRRIKIHSSEEK